MPDALNATRRAQHLDPDLIPAALASGEYLVALRDLDAAVLTLSVAEIRSPESGQVQLLLALAHLEAGRAKVALRHAERAKTLGGHPADVHRVLARAHSAMGHVEEEVRALEEVLRHDPSDLESAVALGEGLALQGRRQEAVKLLTRLAERPPNDAVALVRLGHAMTEASLVGPAVKMLREAIRVNPDMVEAHMELGSALQSAGADKEAVHSYRAAAALRPNDAEIGYRLGLALRDLGRLREASGALIRAAAAAPDDARIEAALGDTLAALKTPLTGTKAAPAATPTAPMPAESTDGGFTGDLQIFTLPELLEFLRNQHATGELLVRATEGEGRVRLHEGQIIAVTHPRRRPLGEVLVDVELITLTDLKRSVIRPEDLDRDTLVAQVLVNQRMVERDTLHDIMSDLIVEGIRELVTWTTGAVVFRRGPPGLDPPEVQVDPRMAILEAMRRIDESAL